MNEHPPTRESRADAWARRNGQAGDVDFTMMYAAHDAFSRDLVRMQDALFREPTISAAFAATWRNFSTQLHIHHTAEDTALWPRLRAASTRNEQLILDDMAAEHAGLDPVLETLDGAIRHGDADAVTTTLNSLTTGLSAHMVHEESEALPLLERRLGGPGWDDFGKHIREQVGGMSGAAQYLPWVLEDADQDVQRRILRLLPAPARLVYRRVWEPRYRKSVGL